VQAQEDAAPDGRSLLVTSLLMADTFFVGACAIVAMYCDMHQNRPAFSPKTPNSLDKWVKPTEFRRCCCT